MMPLYDVLTLQLACDAGQLQIKDITLAMRVTVNRHYRVSEIFGHYFLETGHQVGLSSQQVLAVFEAVKGASATAFATAVKFGFKRFTSQAAFCAL